MDWFAQAYPKQLHVIQLENVRWHTWFELEIPDNVILFFQPPYCAQVNPIERLWKEIKKHLQWELFDNLDRLREKTFKVLFSVVPPGISYNLLAELEESDFIFPN